MPVMNIPVGNQMVGIDVPNFAMEATQQDILDVLRDQTMATRSTAAAQAQTTGAIRSSTNIMSAAFQRQIERQGPMIASAVRAANTGSNLVNATDTGSVSRIISEFTRAIPDLGFGISTSFRAVGSAAATAASILEEYGQNVSNLRRVGVGLTGDLVAMRTQAAEVGLRFDTFSQLVGQNAQTLLNFGSNTQQGALGLINMTREFRKASAEMGYYGLTSREITQLIIDETEARRLGSGVVARTNTEMSQFAQSVSNNIGMHERMAQVLGQDVRARLASQREIEKSAIVQSALNNASMEVRNNLGQIAATIMAVSPSPDVGRKIVNDLMEATLSGVPYLAKDPMLYGRFSDAFSPIAHLIQQVATEKITDANQIQAMSVDIISNFARLSDEQQQLLSFQSGIGMESSRTLLSMAQRARDISAQGNLSDRLTEIQQQTLDSSNRKLGGLATTMEAFSASLNSNLFALATALMPGGTGSGGQLTTAIDGLTNIMNNSMGTLTAATDEYRQRIETSLQNTITEFNKTGGAPMATLNNMLRESADRYHSEMNRLYGELPSTMSNALRSGGPIPVIDVGGNHTSTAPASGFGGQTNYDGPN